MATKGIDTRFVTIGNGIYLSPARTDAVSRVDSGISMPTLVLIFGWMGAKLPHLHKYTKFYEDAYPGAAKVLIRCEPSFFWSRESTRRANLAPVVEVLQSLGYISSMHEENLENSVRTPSEATIFQPTPGIIIHAFSNGGCSQLMCLHRLLASRAHSSMLGRLRPTTVIIFDSCPGMGGLQHSQRAFTGLIRNPVIRSIANVIVAIIYFYYAIMHRLFSMKNVAQVLKAALNNPRLLLGADKDTPRLYIYSKSDELVPYREVEAHAREAEALGLNVRLEQFEGSSHVAHARADPVKYWGAVERVWKEACKSGGQWSNNGVVDNRGGGSYDEATV